MCTLTFVPLERSRIITANRDENARRNAATLSEYKNQFSHSFLIAKEPLHGGTNLAISKGDKPEVTCLLNGAFQRHEFGGNYRLSRGLMVLESLNYSSLKEFLSFDFKGIEPFTLVRFSNHIEELRWDAKSTSYTTYDQNKPHIWSSAQLYDWEIIKERQSWFNHALQHKPLDAEWLAEFHHKGGKGDNSNDLVMNRAGIVQTVSISQIEICDQIQRVTHWNLIEGSMNVFELTEEK